MQLPEFLKKYHSLAEDYLAHGNVKHIEFSGSTYQVQMRDQKSKEDVWAFLQLDPKGSIKDCFCSCDESEDGSNCVHIAVGFLKIYDGHSFPLHQRFERSLWNKLFRLYADRMGYDLNILKSIGKGHLVCQSVGRKNVFFIKGITSQSISHIKELIQHRKVETEETSLKFSNLPQEEIILWREGRPSAELSYELSFWSDLAKWVLQIEESGSTYKINFEYSPNHIPNFLHVAFKQLELGFYLSEANLPLIIPALANVKSPLVVHNAPSDTIQKVVYDKKKSCLHIEPKETALPEKAAVKKGIALNGWLYVPKDGFYVLDRHRLLSKTTLHGREISEALNEHFGVIKSFLEGAKLHQDPIEVSYAIAFDPQWNLHLDGYLFTPGDLTTPYSCSFGDWVYLDDDGFYKLEGKRFDKLENVIPMEEVPEFIQSHRTWLNTHEGFQTHLVSVESQMTYQINEQGYLSFGRQLATGEGEKTKEFGSWVYVSGQGFFSKITSHFGLPFRTGMTFNSEQIPLFIRMNREELKLVPGFFSEKCPVANAGLNIELDPDEFIVVSPVYELHPDYRDKPIRFFDDFVYVKGEGIHELPAEHRLPERFRQTTRIEKENIPLFLTYELVTLRRYAAKIDPRLTKPEQIRLMASSIKKHPQEEGTYLLKLKYQTERGSIPVTTLWQALKEKKRFVFDLAGLFDLEEKRYNWLKLLAKKQVNRKSHTIEMSTLELMRLNAFEEIALSKEKGADYTVSKSLLEELTQFRILEEPDLSGLTSHLRPYQVLGVRWLWFLRQHNLSGLLCDDMGLGKTHQAMALMAAILNNYKKMGDQSARHFLVVCPTSVIYHWQEKLQAFLPGVRVCTFHGSERSLKDFHQQYDVLLTSYGIWRIENELLSQVKFELAIFDEIQIAKNHASRVYMASPTPTPKCGWASLELPLRIDCGN